MVTLAVRLLAVSGPLALQANARSKTLSKNRDINYIKPSKIDSRLRHKALNCQDQWANKSMRLAISPGQHAFAEVQSHALQACVKRNELALHMKSTTFNALTALQTKQVTSIHLTNLPLKTTCSKCGTHFHAGDVSLGSATLSARRCASILGFHLGAQAVPGSAALADPKPSAPLNLGPLPGAHAPKCWRPAPPRSP